MGSVRTISGILVSVVAGLALLHSIYFPSDGGLLDSSGGTEWLLPISPIVSFALVLIGIAHLSSRKFRLLTQCIATLCLCVLLFEAFWQARVVSSTAFGFSPAFIATLGTAPVTAIVSLCALALAQLLGSSWPRNARLHTVSICLSLFAISIGILGLFSYTTNFSTDISAELALEHGVLLDATTALLIVIIGFSKAMAAWKQLIPLLADFERVVSELRVMVVSLFLFVVAAASCLSLVAMYQAHSQAHRDMLQVLALTTRERLETRLAEIRFFLHESLRRSGGPSGGPNDVQNTSLPISAEDASRLGIDELASKSTEPSDLLENGELGGFRLSENSVGFSVTEAGRSAIATLNLSSLATLLAGPATGQTEAVTVSLFSARQPFYFLSHSGHADFSVNRRSRSGRLSPISAGEEVSASIASLSSEIIVNDDRRIAVFSSRNEVVSLLVALALLTLGGSAVLIRLVSSLGNRSMVLGRELRTTVQQLELEMAEGEKNTVAIRNAGREKEVLLGEIHHRVKNNLQIIASIFNLQIRRTDNSLIKQVLQEAGNRLYAISLLHQTLYRSANFAEIDVGKYVNEVARYVVSSLGAEQDVALSITADGKSVEIDKAIPLGLILTEFLTNSIKHAWPVNEDASGTKPESIKGSSAFPKKGQVFVVLKKVDPWTFRLDYSDNGVGLPPAADLTGRESLGMKLVGILTKQLRGNLEYSTAGGAKFSLTFPLDVDQQEEEKKYDKSANSNS